MLVANLFQAARYFFERVFPACRFQLAIAAHQRLAHAFGVGGEVETEAALAAEEFTVHAGLIAIIGAQDFVVAHAEGGLAAVRAVRAGIGDILHFPGARLIAIGAAGERADGTNIDTHTTFFAGQLARLVGNDHGMHAARAHPERFHVHSFIAYAHATEAHDAAWRIVINQRRPLFFRIVQLFFGEAAVIQAVTESHVLQFALAALIADGTIERMIREQELDHILTRFVNLLGVRLYDHAFGSDERARGLQLGHLFHFDQAHAACGLQREARVIAERRDFDALFLGRLEHQRAGRRDDRLAIQSESDLLLFRHAFPSELPESFPRVCARISRADGPQIRCAIS